MSECKKYELDLPYPEVTGRPDPRAVALLLQDYAGAVSEMTALNQYMYQYMLLSEKGNKFAEILECIAVTEMHHKEMLGKAIVRLGGNPIYAANRTYWASNCVNYVQQPQSMILANIKSEYEAIFNYRRHIQMISNTSVQRLLERIILDEELHVKIFQDMLAQM